MTEKRPEGSALKKFEYDIRRLTGGGDTQPTPTQDPTEKKEDSEPDGDQENEEC